MLSELLQTRTISTWIKIYADCVSKKNREGPVLSRFFFYFKGLHILPAKRFGRLLLCSTDSSEYVANLFFYFAPWR